MNENKNKYLYCCDNFCAKWNKIPATTTMLSTVDPSNHFDYPHAHIYLSIKRWLFCCWKSHYSDFCSIQKELYTVHHVSVCKGRKIRESTKYSLKRAKCMEWRELPDSHQSGTHMHSKYNKPARYSITISMQNMQPTTSLMMMPSTTKQQPAMYDLQLVFLNTHYENNAMEDYINDFWLYKIPKCINTERKNTSIVTGTKMPKPKTNNTNNNPNNTLDTGDPNKT